MVKETLKRGSVAVVTFATGLVLMAGYALAQTPPPDPTNGAFTSSIEEGKSWISNYGAAGVFVLAAVGLVIGLALHYFRKSRSAAS